MRTPPLTRHSDVIFPADIDGTYYVGSPARTSVRRHNRTQHRNAIFSLQRSASRYKSPSRLNYPRLEILLPRFVPPIAASLRTVGDERCRGSADFSGDADSSVPRTSLLGNNSNTVRGAATISDGNVRMLSGSYFGI